jgi:hypothetical protein
MSCAECQSVPCWVSTEATDATLGRSFAPLGRPKGSADAVIEPLALTSAQMHRTQADIGVNATPLHIQVGVICFLPGVQVPQARAFGVQVVGLPVWSDGGIIIMIMKVLKPTGNLNLKVQVPLTLPVTVVAWQ